jgi:hypothetical protein
MRYALSTISPCRLIDMKIFVTICLLTIAWSAAADTQAVIDPDDVVVLRAALNPACKNPKSGLSLLRSEAEGPLPSSSSQNEPDLDHEAFISLGERATHLSLLPSELICSKLKRVSISEVEAASKTQPSEKRKSGAFHDPCFAPVQKRFPGVSSVISLSLPGYNNSHDIAVVYLTNWCGCLCAGGWYVQLRRHGSDWVIDKQINVWVS